MENKIEAIKARIAKLRKHSDSAAKLGSKEEAEAFAMKANELLLEYNLLESDIKMDVDPDMFKKWAYSEKLSFKCNQSGQRAKLALVQVLCKHNLCSYIYNRHAFTFEVYGNMENVDTVVWMYNYLSVGLLRLAQEHHVALSPEMKAQYNRYAFLKDFLLGAAQGIDNKLTKQTAANSQSTAIYAMVAYNDKALAKFLTETKTNVRSVKQKTIKVGFGYEKGIKAGEGFSINKPIDKGATLKQIK